jgi:serine/threonine protein kinase
MPDHDEAAHNEMNLEVDYGQLITRNNEHI